MKCPACKNSVYRILYSPDAKGEKWACENCTRKQATPAGAQWSDKDAVVVFVDGKGNVSYPARNDKPTPEGYERVTMRNLSEVRRFEKQHGVTNERMA